MRHLASTAILGLLCSVVGCADTGQQLVSLPLCVAGERFDGRHETSLGTKVTVTRADLAFGPLYLCAGTTAGELCDTARLEWLDSMVVNLLDETPQDAGLLTGVSGPVQSYMYDLGISSQYTSAAPVVLDAAHALDGVSLVLEGTVQGSERDIPFRVAVAVSQTEATEIGAPVVRKSADETFRHEVAEEDSGLLVRFDLAPWLETIDFDALAEEDDCSPENRICSPDESNLNKLRQTIIAGQRPTFEWNPSKKATP